MSYCDVTYLTFCNVRANLKYPSKMCKMAKMSAKHAYRLWEMLEIDFDWNKCRFQVEIKTISSPFILFTFKVMSIKCEIKSHTFAQQKNENVYLKEKKRNYLVVFEWLNDIKYTCVEFIISKSSSNDNFSFGKWGISSQP